MALISFQSIGRILSMINVYNQELIMCKGEYLTLYSPVITVAGSGLFSLISHLVFHYFPNKIPISQLFLSYFPFISQLFLISQ